MQALDKQSTKLDAPIFIGGEGRSGTRLLRSILAKHDNIFEIKRETYLFVESKSKGNKFIVELSRTEDWHGLAMAIILAMYYRKEIAIKKFKVLGGDYDKASYIWSEHRFDAKQDFDQEVLDLYNRVLIHEDFADVVTRYDLFDLIMSLVIRAEKRWIEKTPANIFYSEEIFEMYPQAKFIAMVRDPRAVIASWFKKDPRKKFMPLIWSWRRIAAKIIELQEYYDSDKFCLVKYEDLITEPEATIRKVCDFIGEDFDEGMLDIEVTNIDDDSKGRSGFNTRSLNKWRKQLNWAQIFVVHLFSQDLGEEFGYFD